MSYKRTIAWLGMFLLVGMAYLSPARAAETSQVIAFTECDTGLTGTVNLRLRLFTAPTVGTMVFEETQTGVDASNPCLSVRIGDATAGGIPATVFSANPSLWIAFALESDPDTELGDRTPVTANGYAFKAGAADRASNADQLGGVPTSGFVRTTGGSISGSMPTPVVTVTNTGSGAALTALNQSAQGVAGIFQNTGGGDLLQGKGTSDAPVFRLFNNGGASFSGNVGIGDSNPLVKLSVSGAENAANVVRLDSSVGAPCIPACPEGDFIQGWLTLGPVPERRTEQVFRVTQTGGAFFKGYVGTGGDVRAGSVTVFGGLGVPSYSIKSLGRFAVVENCALEPCDPPTIERLAIKEGNVGIGTANPERRLHVQDSDVFSAVFETSSRDASVVVFKNGPANVAWEYGVSGPTRAFAGTVPTGSMYLYRQGLPGPPFVMSPSGNVGIGTVNPAAKLQVVGRTITNVLQINGGSDLSEQFDVRGTPHPGRDVSPGQVEPGMVVSIDPDHPGKLVVSAAAYNRRVAGIISGAGGVQPGMLMGQSGTLADGQHPVALTGRVYVWADAANGPIVPGDLLTTSNLPGHAMKVTNYGKAQGAILGKAMTGLSKGRGLVLVLVTLQ